MCVGAQRLMPGVVTGSVHTSATHACMPIGRRCFYQVELRSQVVSLIPWLCEFRTARGLVARMRRA